MRKLTKKEYKTILKHQRELGEPFTKKQRKKLKNLTFERLYIYDEGFVIVGNRDGTGDWFANNIPSRCFRVSDVLSERTIQ
tara:strand:- start:1399 stop:1641 length:243 start_codon:yes stop_codon:yes gene_type:complete